jgi:hypothetical protein
VLESLGQYLASNKGMQQREIDEPRWPFLF